MVAYLIGPIWNQSFSSCLHFLKRHTTKATSQPRQSGVCVFSSCLHLAPLLLVKGEICTDSHSNATEKMTHRLVSSTEDPFTQQTAHSDVSQRTLNTVRLNST